MLGNFITRGLLLFLGYAYPAFECFKTVEKNKVEIEELRFWCQYWIIVALLTVFERIGDIFVSWLPFYGETKLVVFIYLWYPKTKGSGYVYNTLLRPYVSRHETDIDRNLQEMRARAWDLLIYYWQNCAKSGQATISQIIHFLLSQSSNVANNASSEKDENPSSPQTNNQQKQQQQSDKNRPPLPTANRAVAQTPKSTTGTVHLHSQAEFIHTDADSVTGPASTHESVSESHQTLHAARLRLRHSKRLN